MNRGWAELCPDPGLVPIRTRGCRSRFYRTKEDCKILGTNDQDHAALYYDRSERAKDKDYEGVWRRVVARRVRKRPNVT